jgi:rare lipoprotein A
MKQTILLIFALFSCFNIDAQAGFEEIGKVSYYADKFHGKKTASGQLYDKEDLTCAHKTLPFGTLLRVTNLKSGNSAIVRVNDRGPFGHGRILDVSRAAAEGLDMFRSGEIEAKLEVVNIEDLPIAKTFPVGDPLPPAPVKEEIVLLAKAEKPSRKDPTTTIKAPAPVVIPDNIAAPVQTPQAGELITGVTYKKEGTYRIELREPTPAGGYVVQVASLSNLEGSFKEIARLQQQAPGQVLVITDDGKNGQVFKLAVGPFEDKSDATKMKDKLAKKGFPKCFVTKN